MLVSFWYKCIIKHKLYFDSSKLGVISRKLTYSISPIKKPCQKVFEVASTDLMNMGIFVVSYTLKDIRDRDGYLKALGMGRTAQVKRDARIGEAHAKMEAQMKEAEAEQERMMSKERSFIF